VPSRARVRVCSSRSAPCDIHRICWRGANRLLMTAFTVDSAMHEEMRSPDTVTLAVVDQAAGVGGDIDGELMRGARTIQRH
jgi:hypothetical protein